MAELNLGNLNPLDKFLLYMVPVVQNGMTAIDPNNMEEIVSTSSDQPETTANDTPTTSDNEVEVISESCNEPSSSVRSSPLILISDITSIRNDESSWVSEPTNSDYESGIESGVTQVTKRVQCSTVLITSGDGVVQDNPDDMRCLCRVKVRLESIELIECHECKTKQHLACNGYRNISNLPKPYFCFWCQKNQTEGASDIRMEVQKEGNRQYLALIRLFTIYYEKHKEIQAVLDCLAPEELRTVLKMLRGIDILQINRNGRYTFPEGFHETVFDSVCFYKQPRIVTGVYLLE